MNKYCITYQILGTDTISPIQTTVSADSEYEASWDFMNSGNFYNTNNPDKIVIISIRLLT